MKSNGIIAGMRLLAIWILANIALSLAAQSGFDKSFKDETLRIDCSFPDNGAAPTVTSLTRSPGWYGRRVNLKQQPYDSMLDVTVTDAFTGDTLYRNAQFVQLRYNDGKIKAPARAIVQIPMPKVDAFAQVKVYSDLNRCIAMLTQPIAVTGGVDIPLADTAKRPPYTTLREVASRDTAIYLAIVAEGFIAEEMPLFREKAAELADSLFCQDAFKAMERRFNVIAVELESEESGISLPSAKEMRNSALKAEFDSVALDRLITLPDMKPLADAVSGLPAGHIIILANTKKYGGSGPYNAYAIAYAGGSRSNEVAIHEFGHSFANLGDEYEEGGYEGMYSPDVEPQEPNITTQHDFSGKWQNLIDSGEAGLVEGAGYCPKGVWRGCRSCLMRTVEERRFCPVCTQAITRTIRYLTEE